MTKLLVLERVGWHISPISPIYFLTSNDFFKNQLDKDIKNPISFISTKCSYFNTTIKPDVIFTFDELVSNSNGDDVNEIIPISEDDFLNMDIKSYYKNILNEELWLKDAKELKLLAKDGNTEDNLVLLIILKEKFIREGKLKIMLSNVNRLYAVYKEKRTSFLFAQMLRINNITNNRNLINNLLKEAKELGIGVGNDVD